MQIDMKTVRAEVKRSQKELLQKGIPIHYADNKNNRRLVTKHPDGRIEQFGSKSDHSDNSITLLIYRHIRKIRNIRLWRNYIS